MAPRVIIAATTWAVNGVNVFSMNLARGLLAAGVPAHILLTEDNSALVTYDERLMPFPADVPFQSLPVARFDSWGTHWGAMMHHLESAAPCVYVPNCDWRHSCICPRLPNNVVVVGVVHSDDPLHYDHVRRLGHTWNAVVAVSSAVAARTAEECPSVADRIVTIPIGVRLPAEYPRRPPRPGPLRLVYHGALKQHQKRVLDLPRIVEAATLLGVTVDLSIAGAGPDEHALRAAAAPLVERGLVRFLGVVPPDDTAALLETQDVYLLASEFEGMPNALIEAMGRGCVPIVTRMKSGIPELIRDGDNGFLVPIGDTVAFAERLRLLSGDPGRREQMSQRAFETVRNSRFRVEDMVQSYQRVFDQAWEEMRAGRFVRHAGPLSNPPPEIAGVGIFPVTLPHVVPDVGSFPSADDAEEYAVQLRGPSRRLGALRTRPWDPDRVGAARAALQGVRVFVAAPVWTAIGVNRWSEDLVRGLRGGGLDARLLLSEEATALVTIDEPRMARPSDLPVEELHVSGTDTWGARWGAMVRLLEAAAPCIYLPNYDWRHSCVVPTLSNRVIVVGTMHDDGGLYTEHAARLGDYWNGLVATSLPVARHVRRRLPALAERLETIPHGVVAPMAPIAKSVDPGGCRIVVIAADSDGHPDARHLTLLAGALDAQRSAIRVVVVDPPPALEAAFTGPGIEVLGRPNRLQWIECCSSGHFVVACSLTGESRRMIVEAMGYGCIPVWIGSAPPDSQLLRDGDTGVVAGDAMTAAARLERLAADPGERARLASRAQAAARSAGGWRADQMIEAYLELFHRLWEDAAAGITQRTRGPLKPPPAQVDNHSVFTPELTYQTPAGAFPSLEDAQRFHEESGIKDPSRRWFWPWR